MNFKQIMSIIILILSFCIAPEIFASNLKRYYVENVLDSDDKIIIEDLYGDRYLVEYGIGCLGMWREEWNYIYIDIGGSILDGIGDTIYINNFEDDCRVWDVDELSGNQSSVIGPASPTSPCTKSGFYFSADNVKYYDAQCILPYNPSWNLKTAEIYSQTCQNGGLLTEEQLVKIIIDMGNLSTSVMSEICKENQEYNKLMDDLINTAKEGFCRVYNQDDITFSKKLLEKKGLDKTWSYKLIGNLYLGRKNEELMDNYYDDKCTLKYDSNITNYITKYIKTECGRDTTIDELITWSKKLAENKNITNNSEFINYFDSQCNKEENTNELLLTQNIDKKLTTRLKGKILLQVENHGEAWYINPKDEKRHYMANGNEAYSIMRNLGVGITNIDLERIKTNTYFAKKHSGKIFLQVEAHGEAFYIDFKGNAHYLKDGIAAYNIMRDLGLGITNNDLNKIIEGKIN